MYFNKKMKEKGEKTKVRNIRLKKRSTSVSNHCRQNSFASLPAISTHQPWLEVVPVQQRVPLWMRSKTIRFVGIRCSYVMPTDSISGAWYQERKRNCPAVTPTSYLYICYIYADIFCETMTVHCTPWPEDRVASARWMCKSFESQLGWCICPRIRIDHHNCTVTHTARSIEWVSELHSGTPWVLTSITH